MKNYYILRVILMSYLMLIGVLLYGQSVVIDANNLGPRVDPKMFGTNLVYTFNNFDQLNAIERQTDFSLVRYPGGSITENELNLSNPEVYLTRGKVPANKGIRRFIADANRKNYTLGFVLPSKRYRNRIFSATREIENYVLNVLNGKYGVIKHRSHVHFEVGNEFFWGSDNLPASTYGKIAVAVIKGVNNAIRRSLRSKNYNISISVQSGLTDTQAAQVAREFRNKPERSAIGYLTWHWYPGRTEIQLGMWRMNGKNQFLSDRLKDIRSQWIRNAGVNKPFYLSEYNIRNRNTTDFDYGLRNPMGVMSVFAESVRANTKMASIWPLVSNTSLRTRYFNSRSHKATFNGEFYKWMENDIQNKNIINGIKNNTYRSNSDFRRNGAYVTAFTSDNEMVIYVHGLEKNQHQFRIDLKGFQITSRKAYVMYTDRGKEKDPNATPKMGRRWPKIWGNNTKLTFTLNRASKYEVVKIVLKGRRTGSSSRIAASDTAVPSDDSLTAEKDVLELSMYPNPVKTTLNVSANVPLSRIEVFDLSGHLALARQCDNACTRIATQSLKNGVYVIKATTKSGKAITKTFIKD